MATIHPTASPPLIEDAYLRTSRSVLEALGAKLDGLSTHQVNLRRQRYGLNTIARTRRHLLLRLLAERIRDPLIIILLLALGISIAFHHVADAVIIGITICMDFVLSFGQVWRTEQTLEKIRDQIRQIATVKRNGTLQRVPSEELVIGDIIEVRAGEKIPADARLLKVRGLLVQEASLTGEADDVAKRSTHVTSRAPLADRVCMIFMGTTVVNGSAEAVVTATGARSEYGRIAQILKTEPEPLSPLHRKLRRTSLSIGWITVAATAVLLISSIIQGSSLVSTVRTAVTLLVSAIPEDLAMMLTVALTVGAARILRKQGVIRQLSSVETLGAATVICTDKTGTLTEGQMTATVFDSLQGITVTPTKPSQSFWTDLAMMSLCLASDARRVSGAAADYIGSATERSALAFAEQLGFDQPTLRGKWRQIDSLAFNPEWKLRASLHQHPTAPSHMLFVNGAPDVLLARSTQAIQMNKEAADLDESWRYELEQKIAARAAQGQRLLAVAVRRHYPSNNCTYADIHNLLFLGVLAIHDPIRSQVPAALQEATAAGVAVKMVTGDHEATAQGIARQVGLTVTADTVCSAETLSLLSDQELSKILNRITIFSRVTPLDKQRIVRLLQQQGHIVAMTGDGVNDAVALKSADIGVAMGSGKDIAKDAADLILLDNSFTTIVAAIREGRVVRDNIRKVVAFLLATNAAEVPLFFVSLLLGLPLPLLPAQLLWINLVIGGTSDIALALSGEEDNVMKRSPESPSGALFAASHWAHIIFAGLVMTASTIGLYWYLLQQLALDLAYARTMAFTFVAVASLLSAWSWHSFMPWYRANPLRNPWIPLSAAFSLLLQLVALYVPSLQSFFGTVPLRASDWLLIIAGALVTVLVIDLRKFFFPLSEHKITHHSLPADIGRGASRLRRAFAK